MFNCIFYDTSWLWLRFSPLCGCERCVPFLMSRLISDIETLPGTFGQLLRSSSFIKMFLQIPRRFFSSSVLLGSAFYSCWSRSSPSCATEESKQYCRNVFSFPIFHSASAAIILKSSRNKEQVACWYWVTKSKKKIQWGFLLGNHNHQVNPHIDQHHIVWTMFWSGLPQPLSSQMEKNSKGVTIGQEDKKEQNAICVKSLVLAQ